MNLTVGQRVVFARTEADSVSLTSWTNHIGRTAVIEWIDQSDRDHRYGEVRIQWEDCYLVSSLIWHRWCFGPTGFFDLIENDLIDWSELELQ